MHRGTFADDHLHRLTGSISSSCAPTLCLSPFSRFLILPAWSTLFVISPSQLQRFPSRSIELTVVSVRTLITSESHRQDITYMYVFKKSPDFKARLCFFLFQNRKLSHLLVIDWVTSAAVSLACKLYLKDYFSNISQLGLCNRVRNKVPMESQ